MTVALITEMFDNLPYFVFVVRNDDTILYCNIEANNVFGTELVGKKTREAIGVKASLDFICTKPYFVRKVVFTTMYKETWFKVYDVDIEWQPNVYCRMITGVDITDLKVSQEKLIHQASTDSMTKAFNKRYGVEFLEKQIEKARKRKTVFTVCYIDLDGLKYINDNFGHKEGDRYINSVVDLLISAKGKNDIVARMGGDEFLLVFPNFSYEVIDRLMSSVIKNLEYINESMKMEVPSKPFKYCISYGILEVSKNVPLDLEYIVNTVDTKMYRMKNEHRKLEKKQKTEKS